MDFRLLCLYVVGVIVGYLICVLGLFYYEVVFYLNDLMIMGLEILCYL